MAGQQYEFTYDTIGNVLTSANLRSATFTANQLNQYTNGTVPGYVDPLGLANSNATITLNGQATYRYGEYFRAEVPVNNSTGSVWLTLTNVGILQAGWGNPDLVSTNLSHAFVSATPQALTYDPDGNLTNDGRFTYTWDQENRLVSMVSLTNTPTDSKRSVTMAYDWSGRRIRLGVALWTNSTWRVVVSNKFLYDGWHLAAELNATNNAVLRTYTWGLDLSGSQQGAGGVGGLLWVNDKTALGTNSNHFVAYDGNGNVSALVDAGSGNETARYEYGPFGDLIRATGPMALANPIRFSSKYSDDATGLIYYGYRYYSPGLQRWLNRDPLGEEGGLNLYGFNGNDPINLIDPLGMEGFWSTFFSGAASDSYGIVRRSAGGAKEFGLIGSDMIGFGLSSVYGAGGDYEGNSRLFQELGSRPECYNATALQNHILRGTLKAEANILTLGLLGLGEAAHYTLETGDYTALQDSLFGTALGLGAMRLSRTAVATAANRSEFVGPRIGRSQFRTSEEFRDAVWKQYQQFYDQADSIAQARVASGRWANDATVIGARMDAFARAQLRGWLASEGISEGPTSMIQVNRWLRNPAGPSHRIPDVRIPGARISLDGTIGSKTATTPQVVDIRAFSGGDNLLIVRPTRLGGSYGIVFP